MNIIEIDFKKNTVKSDFYVWEIVSNNLNQALLLQRKDNGRYRVAEADVARKQMFEVKEISYKGPNNETFFFDEETGIVQI
jgi:hypothetical protein